MVILKKSKSITKKEFEKLGLKKQGWIFKDGKMTRFNTKITYKEVVEHLIREKLTASDEIGIIRQQTKKAEEFLNYSKFVEECKNKAKDFIREREEFLKNKNVL